MEELDIEDDYKKTDNWRISVIEERLFEKINIKDSIDQRLALIDQGINKFMR